MCSVTCGSGVEVRDVICKTFDAVAVEERHCDLAIKPNTTRPCIMEECLVSGVFVLFCFVVCYGGITVFGRVFCLLE